MSKPAAIVTVRTDAKTKKALDRIAKSQDRSINHIVNQAIEGYLDYWNWTVEHVQQGLDEAERGELASHDEVIAEMNALVRKSLASADK